MKNIFILTLSFFSAITMAVENNKIAAQNASEKKPTVILRVMDFSGKVPRVVNSQKVSISKKHQLCWSTVNVPVSEKVRIVEAFYTPSATNFNSPGMTIKASEDKKEFLIIGDVNSVNNEYVIRCWKFDNKDPIGLYRMEIQVGNIIFKDLSFSITK